MSNMQDIKDKFNKMQETVTKLNNEKIGLESEVKTIGSDMSELAKELLTLTGKTTVEEAIEYFKELSASLEAKKEAVSKELDGYLRQDSVNLKMD